jgi:hypothetical protein
VTAIRSANRTGKVLPRPAERCPTAASRRAARALAEGRRRRARAAPRESPGVPERSALETATAFRWASATPLRAMLECVWARQGREAASVRTGTATGSRAACRASTTRRGRIETAAAPRTLPRAPRRRPNRRAAPARMTHTATTASSARAIAARTSSAKTFPCAREARAARDSATGRRTRTAAGCASTMPVAVWTRDARENYRGATRARVRQRAPVASHRATVTTPTNARATRVVRGRARTRPC